MKPISRDKLEVKNLFPGFDARIIHSENATIAFVDVQAGCDLPAHSHHNEQTLNVWEGTFELTLEGEVLTLHAGQSVIIPPHAEHAGRAITKCLVQDVFVPPRKDWM